MAPSVGKRRWWIMTLFFLCYTVLYMARASVSMTGPAMIAHYGWSKTDFGLVSTAFFLGYASTMVLGGALADKLGGGRVLCAAAVLWSLFVFLTPIPVGASALILMIIVRAACGMAQGVALPAMTSMIARWVPKKESGLAQGISLIGVAAGLAVTMPLAAWVINTQGWDCLLLLCLRRARMGSHLVEVRLPVAGSGPVHHARGTGLHPRCGRRAGCVRRRADG